jgi:hypothetical protein
MKIYSLSIITLLLFITHCSSVNSQDAADVFPQEITSDIELSDGMPFDSVEAKYDTLIPIFDDLFITYDVIDSLYFTYCNIKYEDISIESLVFSEYVSEGTKKWGVIDSSGHVIVPFICDGVKAISENRGVVSVYQFSYSLNTGIPRYKYTGDAYFFTKEGIIKNSRKEFSQTIVFIADWHRPEFVINEGPSYYLPAEYRGF